MNHLYLIGHINRNVAGTIQEMETSQYIGRTRIP